MSHKSASVSFGSIKPKPPLVMPGQRVGLLGGSFNPPHEAHCLITSTGRQRLGLDAVWWVVTPGNPLKSHSELAPLSERLKLCERMTSNPAIKITDFEKDLPSAYTAATLAFLKRRYPRVGFVWLMGADNLATFHLWQDWQTIVNQMPIAVVNRPGWRLQSLSQKTAHYLRRSYVPEQRASALPLLNAPAWTFLTGPLSSLSSTEIRENRINLSPK